MTLLIPSPRHEQLSLASTLSHIRGARFGGHLCGEERRIQSREGHKNQLGDFSVGWQFGQFEKNALAMSAAGEVVVAVDEASEGAGEHSDPGGGFAYSPVSGLDG